jgi:RNA polymerase sigma factor (sigma-70 family)
MHGTELQLIRAAEARSRLNTTHWSTVMAAGGPESTRSAEAMEKLCRTYWYPLYAYVRRRGFEQHEAEDLTQGFFARLLAGNYVARATPTKGRFRFYLLAALNHFLSDAWDRERRLKRGGGRPTVPIDVQAGESRYQSEPSHDWSPDRLYERRWALALLEQVLTQLGNEYEAAGKGEIFERLEGFITGDPDGLRYEAIARELRMSQGALRVAVHRLRRRYGELFRLEIEQTVSSPEETREEMRNLLAVLGG